MKVISERTLSMKRQTIGAYNENKIPANKLEEQNKKVTSM